MHTLSKQSYVQRCVCQATRRSVNQYTPNLSPSPIHNQRIRHLTITFLTDVEGDGKYFDRYVKNSKILDFRSRTPCFEHNKLSTEWNMGQWDEKYFPYDREVVFLQEDGMLVYGGDVWDKGGSDLYVIRQLIGLHRRYPGRVHFLMGNRDINKLRIVDELGVWTDGNSKEVLPPHKGVYWLRGTNLIGDPDHTVSSVPSNRVERLKWMLQKTMGSVDAFELRRRELEKERTAIIKSMATIGRNNNLTTDMFIIPVTDEEVTESYMLSCDPNVGVMSQYLARAKLILKFGSAIFMHGALPFLPEKKQLEFPTPWLDSKSENRLHNSAYTLIDWINESNQFAADQIVAWQKFGMGIKQDQSVQRNEVWAATGGYFNNSNGGKMFGKLLQYGMNTKPDRTKNPSVVYNSWMKGGMPRTDIDHSCWYDFFNKHDLQLIASGHQPVGDMPWPIQIYSINNLATKFWIIPCDTSFSGDTEWTVTDKCASGRVNFGRGSGSSGRGDVAVRQGYLFELLVKMCPETKVIRSVSLHGTLSDGAQYKTENLMNENNAGFCGKPSATKALHFIDRQSGEEEEGIFWTKAKVNGHYVASHGKGFKVWNTLIADGQK